MIVKFKACAILQQAGGGTAGFEMRTFMPLNPKGPAHLQ
jgi:hypothetical protein